MLIPSLRHRDVDLSLWTELEQADLLHARCQRLRERVAESLTGIIRFTLHRPACYCGVSWGKDSVVVAYLLRCSAPQVPLMHLRPTNHNPDCDAVRDDYFRRFPGQPYCEIPVDYSDIDRRQIPQQELDRLTDQRWYQAIRSFERPYSGRHILGIRAAESMGRRFRMLRWGLQSPNACAPIGHWSNADVFSYLAANSLPVHPVYAMLGHGRWPRDRLRTAEIGDSHGTGSGRAEWEREYYGDVLRRLEAART